MIRTVAATRYVTPLREGGSLPAIVEADDDGVYVVKFRGAGQGVKALIAEVVAGEIGRALGLPVPEIVLVHFDPDIGRNEPDPEIQELLVSSAGLNAGLDYLPGSLGFDPLALRAFPPALAARIVWFDAFVTNVDRTPRNPNILTWHRETWLIDHGAALYFHHSWDDYLERAATPFPAIAGHVLLPSAGSIVEAGEALAPRLGATAFEGILAAVPDDWLPADEQFASPDARRAAYVAYLSRRLEHAAAFTEEAERARARAV